MTVTATLYDTGGDRAGDPGERRDHPADVHRRHGRERRLQWGYANITIPAGLKSAAGFITTAQDADADDETFTVALGDLSSVTNVTSGTGHLGAGQDQGRRNRFAFAGGAECGHRLGKPGVRVRDDRLRDAGVGARAQPGPVCRGTDGIPGPGRL